MGVAVGRSGESCGETIYSVMRGSASQRRPVPSKGVPRQIPQKMAPQEPTALQFQQDLLPQNWTLMSLPRMYRIRQSFDSPRLGDVASAVRGQLEQLQLAAKVRPARLWLSRSEAAEWQTSR